MPDNYHVSILSEEFRKDIILKLETWIPTFNARYNTNITNKFSQIIHELKKPTNEKARRRFLDVTAQLDEIRNENTYEIIPELQDLLNK